MPSNVLAISIQRRCVAAVIFSDMRLIRMEMRRYPANKRAAVATIYRLIKKLLRHHGIELAALEALPDIHPTRRVELARLAHQTLAKRGIPVTSAKTSELLAAFSKPPCRTRKAMQEIIDYCWPDLVPIFHTPAVLDAAALGLYTQVRKVLQ